MEFSHIINKSLPVNNVDLVALAKEIPFPLMKSFEVSSFTSATAGTWDDGRGLHSSKLYFNPNWADAKKWRIYYTAFGSGGAKVGYAYNSDPSNSNWLTQEITTVKADQPYEDATYGIGTLALVNTPGMAGLLYKAYYQYKDATTGKYESGYMESSDGDTFSNKQKINFDSSFDGYSFRAITSAIWDEQKKKIIATAHITPYTVAGIERLYGAIVESTDGINFRLVTLIDNLGFDHANNVNGDITDLHWIVKFGSAYVILGTTSVMNTNRNISVFYGVSTDLKNWYIPPYMAWSYDASESKLPLRYTSATFVDNSWYIAGIRGTDTFGVSKITPNASKIKRKIRTINADFTGTVDIGASQEISVVPTAGYKATIKSCLISCGIPVGSTSGDHTVQMYIGSDPLNRVFYVKYPYNVIADIVHSFEDGSLKQWPKTNDALAFMLSNSVFTGEYVLKIKYTNNTNTSQANPIIFRLVIEEELIAY